MEKRSQTVTLRKKNISKNRSALYLDIYPGIMNLKTRKIRRREFLKMYIYEPIKILERKYNKKIKQIPLYNEDFHINSTYIEHNKNTLEVAEIIRRRREIGLNESIFKLQSREYLEDQDFEEEITIPDQLKKIKIIKKMMPISGIYFLYKCGTLQYIGQAKDLYRRIFQHSHKKEIEFDDVFFFKCKKCFLDVAELHMIREFNPPLNVKLKGESFGIFEDS